MKLAMFKTQEELNEWARNMAEAIRNNGYRFAKDQLNVALSGIGKRNWMVENNASESDWDHYVEWRKGQVEYLERKIRKYEKMIK